MRSHDRIVIEVGCHKGSDTPILYNHYRCPLYGFEPHPQLWSNLAYQFRTYPEVKILQYAIGLSNDTVEFHLSPDTGCSSLYEFTENITELWNAELEKNAPWEGKRKFEMTNRVTVRSIRMDTFLDMIKFDGVIDFMHCDAQGNDLNVLKSFGNKLHMLKAGVIETTRKNSVNLYKNNENFTEDAVEFLESNGFYIKDITLNDRANSEDNILFEKK